jgi:hypothetical protein
MDELDLKHESLGHFHESFFFLFLFNLEHKASFSFLNCFSLKIGVHFTGIYLILMQILIMLFIPASFIFEVEGYSLSIVKIALYAIGYICILIPYYGSKKLKNMVIVPHTIFTILYYYNLVMIGYTYTEVLKLTILRLILIFIVPTLFNLYLLWVIYSSTTHISKEKKYILHGKHFKKPSFLMSEYECLIDKS